MLAGTGLAKRVAVNKKNGKTTEKRIGRYIKYLPTMICICWSKSIMQSSG